MTDYQNLAEFAAAARFDRLGAAVVEALKIRTLDTIGVCIGALDAAPTRANRDFADPGERAGAATLIGGGHATAEAAARYNVTLSRQLDFMDAYLAPAGICHPSDSVGALLPVAETVGASGQEFLAALAVAYAVHVRLADALPADATSGLASAASSAIASAAAKVLRLDAGRIGQAVISATRQPDSTGSPTDSGATDEGALTPIGTGDIDWSDEMLESVLRTIVLRHNADPLAQSAIDAALSLATPPVCDTRAIRRVTVKTFQAAYDALGGAVLPDARRVASRRAAIRSLAYLVAVALLDHQVQPGQFAQERIAHGDVQGLLRSVKLMVYPPFTRRFPAEMPAQIEVELIDGTYYCTSAVALQEFTLRPLPWEVARDKFYRLVVPLAEEALARRIAQCVHDLDSGRVRDLTALLAEVPLQRWRRAA